MKIDKSHTTYVSEPAGIFSQMLQIGIPDFFKSDLWHDAIMLNDLWKKQIQTPNKPWWFYWTLRESGTHMGEDLHMYVTLPCQHFHIKGAYQFAFSQGHEGQKDFLLTITRLNKVGQEAKRRKNENVLQ